MGDVLLNKLMQVIESRKKTIADDSYVASLFSAGREKILKKIGEEASEVVIAGAIQNNEEIVYEVADLWFHTLVLLSDAGLSHKDVLSELEGRFGLSGLEEKASRDK